MRIQSWAASAASAACLCVTFVATQPAAAGDAALAAAHLTGLSHPKKIAHVHSSCPDVSNERELPAFENKLLHWTCYAVLDWNFLESVDFIKWQTVSSN